MPVPDEAVALAALVQRGWVVAPGARYRLQSPPGLRVTVAQLDPADAGRLAEDLASVLSGWHGIAGAGADGAPSRSV